MMYIFYLQAVMDHGSRVAKELVTAYERKCSMSISYSPLRDATIDTGLRLGKVLTFICIQCVCFMNTC
jgi:hypothetical protein